MKITRIEGNESKVLNMEKKSWVTPVIAIYIHEKLLLKGKTLQGNEVTTGVGPS